MKRILFWISETILLIALILWLCFTLNYYHAVDLKISGLPTLNESLTNSGNAISNLPGFATIPDIGSTMLIFGIGGFIVYLGIMLAMYFSQNVSKTLIFWLNIGLYSLFLIAFILGLLFINLDL